MHIVEGNLIYSNDQNLKVNFKLFGHLLFYETLPWGKYCQEFSNFPSTWQRSQAEECEKKLSWGSGNSSRLTPQPKRDENLKSKKIYLPHFINCWQ